MPICPVCKLSSTNLAVLCSCKKAYTIRDDSLKDPARRLGILLAEKYLPISLLASNNHFSLYEAKQLPVDRRVTLRILTPETAANDLLREQYHRAVADFSTINHPNLVTVYEFSRTPDGTTIISSEWIRGKKLSDYLSLAEFDTVAITHIIHQILLAFSEAHTYNQTHPCISLDCINVSKVGNDPFFIKVSHYGDMHRTTNGEKPTRVDEVAKIGNLILQIITESNPPFKNPVLPPHRQLLTPILPVLMRAIAEQSARYKTARELLQDFELALNISISKPQTPVILNNAPASTNIRAQTAPTIENIAWMHVAPQPKFLK